MRCGGGGGTGLHIKFSRGKNLYNKSLAFWLLLVLGKKLLRLLANFKNSRPVFDTFFYQLTTFLPTPLALPRLIYYLEMQMHSKRAYYS